MLSPDDFTEEQDLAIDRLYEHEETILIAPKGFGKCIVGYTALDDLLNAGKLTRVLVVSTSQVCTLVWAEEAKKWSHLLLGNFVCLTGKTPKQREKLMAMNTPIVICNIEIIPWLFKTYPKHNFDGLLVDEITKLKSVGTGAVKKLRHQTKHFKWRVGMTADPVAQESMEIYSQMLIIDQGKRLGRNQENFKRNYFMQMDYMGYNWDFQPGGLDRLTEILSDVIYTVDGTSYDDELPRLNEVELGVWMPEVARAHYKKLAQHSVINIDDTTEIIAPNEAVLQGKLHQLSCGGLYFKEHEFATENKCVFMHSVVMGELATVIHEAETPLLIAYQFDFQRSYLVSTYNAPVFSAANGKKANDELLRKWDNGELPILLIHPKSGSHGLNLQNGPGHTLVCLGYFWSADEWDQLLGRLRRRGQKSPFVTRITIYCYDTVQDCVMKPNLKYRLENSELFHKYLKTIKEK